MYDTKKKELRWNATYFDYAATLPDEDIKYSKNLVAVSLMQWSFVYRQKSSDIFVWCLYFCPFLFITQYNIKSLLGSFR